MDLKGGRGAPHGRGVGVIITTDKGTFIGGRGGGRFQYAEGQVEEFAGDPAQQDQDGTNSHFENFVTAITAGDRGMLRADCSTAANSASMAHMANVSFQLAQPATASQLERAYSGTVTQRDMLARLRESTLMYALANAEASSEAWLLGPPLTFDNASVSFTGELAEEANQLMTRHYRAGFELPKV